MFLHSIGVRYRTCLTLHASTLLGRYNEERQRKVVKTSTIVGCSSLNFFVDAHIYRTWYARVCFHHTSVSSVSGVPSPTTGHSLQNTRTFSILVSSTIRREVKRSFLAAPTIASKRDCNSLPVEKGSERVHKKRYICQR